MSNVDNNIVEENWNSTLIPYLTYKNNMKKIKLISVLLFLCLSIEGIAQSRINANAQAQVIITDQSPKLRVATGWKQDNLGNWISNANAISDTQLNGQSISTVPQNFKWLQFVTFKANNQDLYALLYENLTYVSSTQTERRVNYYIMTANSYSGLVDNINNKTGETLTIHSSSYGYMSDSDGVFTQNKLMQLIAQTVGAVSRNQYDFSLNAQFVDNAYVVRFRLPEQSTIMGGSMKEGYFEANYDEFKACLLPVLSVAPSEFDLNATTPSTATVNSGLDEDFSLADSTVSATTSDQLTSVNATDANDIADADILITRTGKAKAIVSEPISVLKNIKGWYNNDQSEWVSDDSPSYRFETVGRYEIRSMSYKQKEYFIFTKYEKFTGANFYLVAKEDYIDQVKEIMGQSIIRLPYICNYSSGYTLDDFVKQAEVVLDTPKSEQIIIRTNNIVIQYKVSKTKNIARFFIFGESCTQYGANGNKTCDTKTSSKIKYDDAPLLTTEALFTKMYYETTYDAFNDFLQKPLTVTIVKNNPKTAVSTKNDDRN